MRKMFIDSFYHYIRKLIIVLLITLYNLYLSIKICIMKLTQNTHRYKLIFLEHDEEGAFFLTHDHTNSKKKVYLRLHKAQPLKGIRIGDHYYTMHEEYKQIKVKDDDF